MDTGYNYVALTIPEVSSKIHEARQGIDNMMSNATYGGDVKGYLINLRDRMAAKEVEFLNFFNIGMTVTENNLEDGIRALNALKTKIEQEQEKGFKLTGSYLLDYINTYRSYAKSDKEWASTLKFLRAKIKENSDYNFTNNKEFATKLKEYIVGEINSKLSEEQKISDSDLELLSTGTTKKSLINNTELMKVLSKNLSKSVRTVFGKEYESYVNNIFLTEGKEEIEFWYKLTEGKTGKQAKESYSKRELSDINREIIYILQEIFNPSEPAVFNTVLQEMLTTNNTAFFFGKNANQLTGLIGEIWGLYLLKLLIAPQYVDSLRWSATDLKSGKQSPKDIVLNIGKGVGYGIQIKNSTKSIEDEHFINLIGELRAAKRNSTSTAETFFERLNRLASAQSGGEVSYFTSEDFLNTVRSIYTMNVFNVEVADVFSTYRSTIEGLTNSLDIIYLNLFEMLTQMSVIKEGNNFEAETGNVLFIVQDKFYFATELINRVIKEIEVLKVPISFKTQIRYSGVTYADMFAAHKFEPVTEDEIFSQIYLSTPYNFGM